MINTNNDIHNIDIIDIGGRLREYNIRNGILRNIGVPRLEIPPTIKSNSNDYNLMPADKTCTANFYEKSPANIYDTSWLRQPYRYHQTTPSYIKSEYQQINPVDWYEINCKQNNAMINYAFQKYRLICKI